MIRIFLSFFLSVLVPSISIAASYPMPAPFTNNTVMVANGTKWTAASAAPLCTVASTSTIANDTTTNATMYPLWVTANTGNLPLKVSSTKMSFNPSTGLLTSTSFTGDDFVSTAANAHFEGGTNVYVTADTGLIKLTSGNTSYIHLDAAGSGAYIKMESPDIAASLPLKTDASNHIKTEAINLASSTEVSGILPNAKTTAASANTASAIVARDGSGNFSAGTISAALTGNVTGNVTGTADNATNTAITNDTTTNATMYPTWVTTTSGNLPQKVSSTKMTFNPSTGMLTTTGITSALTGNASTATALAANGANCSSGQYGLGVDASGASESCAAITVLGTIATGVWNGTAVGAVYGGTAQTSWTAGDIMYASASNTLSKLAKGTDGQYLTLSSGLPAWAGVTATVSNFAPTIQNYTSGTNASHNLMYAFTITSGNATAGDTYTNNTVTFTAYATVSSATIVYMSGSGAPAASGTLTRASGTGDATLTFSAYKAPLYLYVLMVGGGGGGGCGGNNGACSPAAGDGTATCFGTNATACTTPLFSAAGGAKGTNGTPGAGGAATINSPAQGLGTTGEAGSGFTADASGLTTYGVGSLGGSSMFGGRGYGNANDVGQPAVANTGSGGGGGGYTTAATLRYSGCGGGSGANIRGVVLSPAATYNYTVGAAGAAATAGNTNGFAGGAGAAGRISVWSMFQ